jgi:thioredoxin-like negative regulator of GroEL
LSGCTGKYKTKEQLLNEGIELVQNNNPGGAIILFKNALDKDQNYFEARFRLAKAYYAIGKLDAAEKELRKVRRQDPSSRTYRSSWHASWRTQTGRMMPQRDISVSWR